MQKKGMSVQFNWIFVIVAGVIILGFFVLFTVKYIELQDMKQNADVSKLFTNTLVYLEGQEAGAGYSIDSSSNLAFKVGYFINLNYQCDEDSAGILINNVSNSYLPLNEEILFAPSNMQVNALDTWVLPWNYPYFVSNFVYLSSPGKKFYIKYDYNSYDFARELRINRQAEFDVELVNDLDEVKGDDVTVLWISDVEPSLSYIKKLSNNVSNFNFMRFKPVKVKEDYVVGILDFYEDKKVQSFKVYGEEVLYGAMFAEEADTFSCVYDRLMKRFDWGTEVFISRLDLLTRADQGCATIYGTSKPILNGFKENPALIDEVVKLNRKVMGESCVSIY
jgi:hypothetical protein